jgi:hypothetical protein
MQACAACVYANVCACALIYVQRRGCMYARMKWPATPPLGAKTPWAISKYLRRLTVKRFITGQKEREETTQDIIVTKSAAFASYEINYLT